MTNDELADKAVSETGMIAPDYPSLRLMEDYGKKTALKVAGWKDDHIKELQGEIELLKERLNEMTAVSCIKFLKVIIYYS